MSLTRSDVENLVTAVVDDLVCREIARQLSDLFPAYSIAANAAGDNFEMLPARPIFAANAQPSLGQGQTVDLGEGWVFLPSPAVFGKTR